MSASSSRQHPSTVSLNKSTSVRSARRPPPPISTVVTSPPWARDEPPSPKDSIREASHITESRISDVTSFQSDPSQAGSRWWSFTLPRTRQDSFDMLPASPKMERRGFREISLAWMPTSSTLKEGASFMRSAKEKESVDSHTAGLPIPLAPHLAAPYTVAQTSTPGWDTPWTSRQAAQGPVRNTARHEDSYGFQDDDEISDTKDVGKWASHRKRLRNFILSNTYVPLLFRFINITFTTAALGMAIRIRNIERRNQVTGAVGSSPTVVIIFAPLTLLHVMAAIYLEYFGRPLGLWRTSTKLAHTLSEVLFICAWSAALSLCFDNFFTSLIPCASPSSTAWYNHLPRPHSNVPGFEGSLGDRICDHQLSLICLVAVGLIAYCSNLIISLYRIFEIVKYHPAHSVGFPRTS